MTDIQPEHFSPFPPEYRASGILLHVTSLPSPYGIGDIGSAALSWIDRIHDAGQSWWQALPMGPTGYGNSPYQPMSSFAGNGLLISPDDLINDGLLRSSDLYGDHSSSNSTDYINVIPLKHRLLEAAWRSFSSGARADLREPYEQFCNIQAHWLDDYALFRALKIKYGSVHYLQWPQELVRRVPAAIAQARQSCLQQIDQVRFSQFLLFRQGERLKKYVRTKGIRLIGDLPFYVSPDSSDVWANPELFMLDTELKPRFVGGVPPDDFSASGQLWGNPVYDWNVLRGTGYRWCIDRVRALLAHVDVIRLDHFRGFAAAWHVPAGAATAESGRWVSGPGADFFTAVERELGYLPFIAEDLGVITADVRALRDRFKLPGTRVLQFAFDGNANNPHLPNNYASNTVVYTGTHDNNTTRGWFEELSAGQQQKVWHSLGRPTGTSAEATTELIRFAWSSPAGLAIAPLQDLLKLGSEARMNIPGRAEGNWRWRVTDEMLSSADFQWLRDLTRSSGRSALAHDFPAGQKISQ
jgi:4-alpha-glucanotransferase